MFVAVFSAVGYTMLVKKLADDYNPITITAYQSFYGLLMFLPLFLIFEMPLPDFRTVSMSSLFWPCSTWVYLDPVSVLFS